MRRNRRNNAKKERIIMIASSAFVLAALTMTGIYMKSNQVESQDDGYTIDFTQIEDNVPSKIQEIAQNNQVEDKSDDNIQNGISIGQNQGIFSSDFPNEFDNLEDDLDYTPMEAGSGQIEIPGLTDGIQDEAPLVTEAEDPAEGTEEIVRNEPTPEPEQPRQNENETAGSQTAARDLHFTAEEGLARPVSGEVLIPFSMDKSVYFSTLDQYKYNPALMIAAEEGEEVTACAEGRVVEIFENEEIGQAVTMELGDGYLITYGQLQGINVAVDSYVNPGQTIAAVAAPTKYFAVEGSNLYLKLTADEAPVDPELLFR